MKKSQPANVTWKITIKMISVNAFVGCVDCWTAERIH